MKKILPIDVETVVNSYHITAFYSGILKGRNYDIKGLTVNHFIDLSYWKNIVDHTENTAFKKNAFSCLPIRDKKINIVDIINAIISGYYAVVIYDESKVKDNFYYGRNSLYHDLLIYGFDDEKKHFYALSYLKKHKAGNTLSHFTIPFSDIEDFNEILDYDESKVYTEMRNHLCKPNEFFQPEKIDINIVVKKLKRYLKPIAWYKGIRVYKLFIRSIKQRNRKKKNRFLFDMRNFKVFQEHFRVIKILVEETTCQQTHIQQVEKLNKKVDKLVLLAGKYNIRKDQATYLRVIEELKNLRELEKIFIKSYINSIDTY